MCCQETWLAEMSAGLGETPDTESLSPRHTIDDSDRLSVNPAVRRDGKKTEKQRKKEQENKAKVCVRSYPAVLSFVNHYSVFAIKNMRLPVNRDKRFLKKAG